MYFEIAVTYEDKNYKNPFCIQNLDQHHKNYVKIKFNFTKINGLLSLLPENIIQRIILLVPTEKVKT